MWFGRTKAADYDGYLAYLEESGVAELQATPGNRGVMVLRRLDGHEAEFGVVSLWDSLDDVKAFAGQDVDAAHYYPEDETLPARVRTEGQALRGHSGALGLAERPEVMVIGLMTSEAVLPSRP
jgi:heme-degrading monooxygenase HmoA